MIENISEAPHVGHVFIHCNLSYKDLVGMYPKDMSVILAALKHSIQYCNENGIEKPIFYIFTCRIGLFISSLVKQIKSVGGMYMLNPDGDTQIISR